MLNNARIRTLLSEADALQGARARLYIHLDLMLDMCDGDARVFVDVFIDVATLQARHNSTRTRAWEWVRLRKALKTFLEANPPARCARREGQGRP
jgi:hypothetical protein